MKNNKYTIPTLLNKSCKKYAKKVALQLADGKSISFKDMMWDITRTSQILKTEGIEKGDKVAMFYNNDPQTVETFMAITRIGAVAIMYPDTFSEAQINAILESEKPEAVFVSETQRDTLKLPANASIIDIYNNNVIKSSNKTLSSSVYSITDKDLAATVYQLRNDDIITKFDYSHKQIVEGSKHNIDLNAILSYAKKYIYPLFKGISIYCKEVLINISGSKKASI